MNMNMNMNGGRLFNAGGNNTEDVTESAAEIFEKVRGILFSKLFLKINCWGMI